MEDFERQRTKDIFTKKSIYKNWVMILAEMCLEWVKRKDNQEEMGRKAERK